MCDDGSIGSMIMTGVFDSPKPKKKSKKDKKKSK